MCGCARLSSNVSEIKLVFSIPPDRPTPKIAPSWNVAPTDRFPGGPLRCQGQRAQPRRDAVGARAVLGQGHQSRLRKHQLGDDDQTLYAFRASDIRTILDFGRHHPGARIHTLEVNYRAGAAIVDAAKALIRHNRTRVDKDYRPVLTEPGEIVIRGYSSPEIEARQVAAAIAELLGQGEAPGQITILYRAGAIGLNFQTALKERQIPFEVRGSGDLWQSVGARLVVGALHYLHGGATVAAMSRLGTGQRSRIIVEHLDQIRPTVGHDFTLSCPHVERIVGEALPAKASDRERNEWTSLVQSVVSVAVSCASLAALERCIAEQSAALRAPPDEAVVLSTLEDFA